MKFLIRRANTLNKEELINQYSSLFPEACKMLVLPLVMNYKKKNTLNITNKLTSTDIITALDNNLVQTFNSYLNKKLAPNQVNLTFDEVKTLLHQYLKPEYWQQYFLDKSKNISTSDKIEKITPDICKEFITLIADQFQSKDDLLKKLNAYHVDQFNQLLNKRLNTQLNKNFNLSVPNPKELGEILVDYVPGNWNKYFSNQTIHIKSFNDIKRYFGNDTYTKILKHIQNNIKNDLENIINHCSNQNGFLKQLQSSNVEHMILKKYILEYVNPQLVDLLSREGGFITVSINPSQFSCLMPSEFKFIQQQVKIAIEKFKLNNSSSNRLLYYVQDSTIKNQFDTAKYKLFDQFFSLESLKKYINDNNIKKDYESLMQINSQAVFNFYFNQIKDKLISQLKLSNKMVNNKFFDADLKKLLLDNPQKMFLKFYENLNKLILPLTRLKLKDLEDVNFDKKGDSHYIDIATFDQNNRELAFIILNGRLFFSQPGETHINIIERLKNLPKEKFYRSGIESLLEGKYDSLVFGHIVDNVAFLENQNIQGNITATRAIEILTQNPRITKVYTDIDQHYITRLAKKYKGVSFFQLK